MPKNPWVAAPRMNNDDIEAAIAQFKKNGGEIIEVPENFNPEKKRSETAVKLGSVYRKLRATKKKE